MIIQFNFRNFKSFRDEGSLNMIATKNKELPEHVVDLGRNRLLKVAAIYGANASGKSNVYAAYEYMTYLVLESFRFGGGEIVNQKKEDEFPGSDPFLLDDSERLPSMFEVFFIDNLDKSEKTYQYGFEIDSKEIVEEWLYVKAKSSKEFKTIFYRKKGEKMDLSGLGKSAENIKLSLEKETLIVSLGAKLKIEKLKFVRDWFMKNVVVDFGDPFENLMRSRMLPDGFPDDKNVQENIVRYISSFDKSIKDFNVEKVDSDASDDDSDKISLKIDSIHKGKEGKLVPLPLRRESSGTLKMFALYEPIVDALRLGGTLFIDELNARLHPLLVRNIILAFLDPAININNAQLVFTTHDIWQIQNDFLRRDEIWFVEKDEETGASDLYSLADFVDEDGVKIRKDAAYAKNYLYGNYGAIPKLDTLDIMKGVSIRNGK